MLKMNSAFHFQAFCNTAPVSGHPSFFLIYLSENLSILLFYAVLHVKDCLTVTAKSSKSLKIKAERLQGAHSILYYDQKFLNHNKIMYRICHEF